MMRPWFHARFEGMIVGRLGTNMTGSPSHPYLPQHQHLAGTRGQGIKIVGMNGSLEPALKNFRFAVNVGFSVIRRNISFCAFGELARVMR
jgi:hypothetical protein